MVKHVIPKQGKIATRRFGRSLRLAQLKALAEREGIRLQRYPDAHVMRTESGLLVFFISGIVVEWAAETGFEFVQTHAADLFDDLLPQQHEQKFSYKVVPRGKFSIEFDVVTVPANQESIMVSISHATARSVQLEYNELLVSNVLEHIAPVPHALKTKGKIGWSRTKIRKMIGLVVEAQHNVNTFGLSDDHPELLWDQPELATYYRSMGQYLELHERWSTLSVKISFLGSTLSVLRDESNARHAHVLEWIIIWLIVIEVMFTLNDFFRISERLLGN